MELFTVEASSGISMHLCQNVGVLDLNVKLGIKKDIKHIPDLTVHVGDFVAVFKGTSKEAKEASYSHYNDIIRYFTGATFAFVEDTNGNIDLLDYVPAGQMVLPLGTIEELAGTIGIERADTKRPFGGGPKLEETFARHRGTSYNRNVLLSSVAAEEEMDTHFKSLGEGDGAKFKLRVKPQWSPFSHLKFVLETIRLVCTNGMMGMNEALQAVVPIYNQVEKNLETSRARVMDEFENVLHQRFSRMNGERASIAVAQKISDFAKGRIPRNLGDEEALMRLKRIQAIASPRANLRDHYSLRTLQNVDLKKTQPSHLSLNTAWNLLTEVDSYTQESSSSTSSSLQLEANKLVFETRAALTVDASRFEKSATDVNDSERVFWGKDD